MESLGINIKYRNIIKSLYKNTQFKVEIDGVESEWEQQATGIRQGCPLSPYLFILVMTVMFDEIHKELGATLIEKRIPGVTFDEILYADDTICIGTDTKSINKFLKAIEEKGKEFGLKLNQTKCEVVTSMRNPNVHFKDGTRVKIVEEAKYLGCHINEQSDYRKELGKRISIAMITLKKLDIFWLHSNCPAKFKLQAADAIIRTKILYGLESAQLGEPELKRLDLIQLKIFRKILGLKTTFVNRENTNVKLWKDVRAKTTSEGKKKHIVSFRQAYRKAKIQTLAKILLDERGNKNQMIFDNELQERMYSNRRVGRPKTSWTEAAIKEMWEEIRNTDKEWRHKVLDLNNQAIRQRIKERASEIIDKNKDHSREPNTPPPLPPPPASGRHLL